MRTNAHSRAAGWAGIVAGPIFFVLASLNTWASLDWLHSLGWQLAGGESLPYPSGLALGPHGWLQVANYLVTGALLVVFSVGFAKGLDGVLGRIAGLLTLGFALSVLLTALRIDHSMLSSEDPETWNGWFHALGALAGLLLALLAMIFVGLALRRDPEMRIQSIVSFLAPVAVIAAGFTPLGLAGSLLTVFAWYVVLGVGLIRVEDRASSLATAQA